MPSRRATNDQVAEVARRRLELLSAELAGIRQTMPPTMQQAQGNGDGNHGPARTADAPVAGGEPAVPDPRPAPDVPGRHAHRPVGAADRAGGWLHDRLPPTMQGTIGLAPGHLTVIAVVVAAAMAAAAWWVLRADGDGTVVPPAASSASGAPLVDLSDLPSTDPSPPLAPGGTGAPDDSSTQGPGPAARILVDVAGKVRRPGITRLPAGSRVADALRSAGGARRGVNLTALNLARVLVDGEQILVGVRAPTGVAPPAASAPTGTASGTPTELVNVNTADQVELETLPGVGPVTAQAIMTWRADNGAFGSVDELLEVSGIGEVTLSEMAPYVTI